jgi:hypothetical protein
VFRWATLKLVLPIHHDTMLVTGEEARREWVNEVNDYLIEHGSVWRSISGKVQMIQPCSMHFIK